MADVVTIVPAGFVASWLQTRAGLVNLSTVEIVDGETRLAHPADAQQAVDAAIAAYPTAYADEVLRPDMLAAIAERRWQCEQQLTLGGDVLPCDIAARGNVTAAIVDMERPDAPAARRWKFGPNDHRELDLATLGMIGRAMADHVQACFDREGALAAAIVAAADVDALAAIDIEAGWPS